MNKRKLPNSNSFLENEKSDPKRAEFQTGEQEDQEVFFTAPNNITDENNNQMRYKIKELNDSLENPQIEARVKSVSNIITYGKTGRLVEVVLSDETGDIRAIIYRELIKKIVLKENELTRISGFKVKKAYKNQKFGTHEFEICMTASTLVDRINQQIIEQSPNKLGITFTRLSNVMSKKPNDKVSIFGIMSDNLERVVINNRVVVNIHLFDESITLVRCTLWENLAKQLTNIKDPNPIIVLENAKICELDEKFVSSDARTRLYVNPDLEETEDLLLWFYINFKQ